MSTAEGADLSVASLESTKDEALFREPPQRDECDICMLPLPLDRDKQRYQSCCGKVLCCGCIDAAYAADNRCLCPFCRTPRHTSNEELMERLKKRVEGNDARAIRNLGSLYYSGDKGLPQNYDKAMELWLRAGELGCVASYGGVGDVYRIGEGVQQRDEKKAIYYYELAAMGGYAKARHNLGVLEWNAGIYHRAVKHYMISAGAGYDNSLTQIREAFLHGHATKDDFEKALRAHKEAKDEMKSDQREAAVAFLAAHDTARGQR